MLAYLPGLVLGALCLAFVARLKRRGREREAGFALGLGIVLIAASVVAAGLSLVGDR